LQQAAPSLQHAAPSLQQSAFEALLHSLFALAQHLSLGAAVTLKDIESRRAAHTAIMKFFMIVFELLFE
jgi:hypothetical protein